MIGAMVSPTGYPSRASQRSAAIRFSSRAVPPSNRVVIGRQLTLNRTRVRPWCGNPTKPPTSSYLVVQRRCTGASQAPKYSTARRQLPVRCSSASGSV
jgi:hypothetical protein